VLRVIVLLFAMLAGIAIVAVAFLGVLVRRIGLAGRLRIRRAVRFAAAHRDADVDELHQADGHAEGDSHAEPERVREPVHDGLNVP